MIGKKVDGCLNGSAVWRNVNLFELVFVNYGLLLLAILHAVSLIQKTVQQKPIVFEVTVLGQSQFYSLPVIHFDFFHLGFVVSRPLVEDRGPVSDKDELWTPDAIRNHFGLQN